MDLPSGSSHLLSHPIDVGYAQLTNLKEIAMKTFALSAATAAMLVFATVSYAQTSGANKEFPAAGAPTNAPTLQEQVTKTPGSSANPEFPAAGAPLNVPTPKEEVAKTPGSSANPEYPAAGAPLRDKKD
jgi:hypothetical protein